MSFAIYSQSLKYLTKDKRKCTYIMGREMHKLKKKIPRHVMLTK